MFDIAGTTAIVTGGAKRLGRETAMTLARSGCNVVVHYNTSEREAEAVAASARELGVRAWAVAADLASPEEASRLMERASSIAGEVELLVNSASVFPPGTLDQLTEESLSLNLRLNTLSPLFLARRFRDEVESRGGSGAIVNFLDTRILDYDRNHVAYHLSKQALFALTRMMSNEFAPTVRVNAVAPGLILPPPGEDDSFLDRLSHTNPLNTHGSAEQVAATVLFLLWNRFVTGQVIYVDGGRHMKGRFYGS